MTAGIQQILLRARYGLALMLAMVRTPGKQMAAARVKHREAGGEKPQGAARRLRCVRMHTLQ